MTVVADSTADDSFPHFLAPFTFIGRTSQHPILTIIISDKNQCRDKLSFSSMLRCSSSTLNLVSGMRHEERNDTNKKISR